MTIEEMRVIIDTQLTWWYQVGQHDPEYGGGLVDAIADALWKESQ